jgi:iron complex transport system permease protein
MSAATAGAARTSRPLRGRAAANVIRTVGLLAAIGVLAIMAVLSIGLGSVSIQPVTVVDAFTNYDPANQDHLIVRGLRLVRTAIAIAVGGSLALSGAVTQGLTRNPLGDPSILGITAGAAFAIVTMVHFVELATPAQYVWFGFIGAIVATTGVYAIASSGGRPTPFKIALAGVIVSALLTSWIAAVLTLDQRTLDEVRFWLVGSLKGRSMDDLLIVAPIMIVATALSLLVAQQLNILNLGEDVAAGLGQRTTLVKVVAGAAVVLLAGSAVAVAGPIVFVGLAIPHIVRGFVGPDYRWVLPYSLVGGAILLVSADIVGRTLVAPQELHVGVVTALIGGPFLIYLVRRGRMGEL